MSEKFTPGPWSHDGFVTVFGPNGLSVAHTSSGIRHYGEDSAIANAHLIAAAPEMYAALKAIIEQWDTPNWKLTEHTGVLIEAGRAALAKTYGVEIHSINNGETP